MTLLILLLGFVVGVISGIVGIGGGVVLIPALVWLLGMSQRKAQGTSLAALLPVGIFAFWTSSGKEMLICALGCWWLPDSLWAGFSVGGARNMCRSCGCGVSLPWC
jgi:uncharacterized membrane protein YfcA